MRDHRRKKEELFECREERVPRKGREIIYIIAGNSSLIMSEEGVRHYPREAQRSPRAFNEVLQGVRQ